MSGSLFLRQSKRIGPSVLTPTAPNARMASRNVYSKLKCLGRSSEATAPDALKAVFAEFIATFLFVFIGVGSCIAYSKLSDGPLQSAGLVSIAIAHGLAIVITVAATANLSGGHVNPAVTFGLALGGHITILRSAFYWIAQLLGATLASYLLKDVIATAGHGETMPVHGLGDSVTLIGGLVPKQGDHLRSPCLSLAGDFLSSVLTACAPLYSSVNLTIHKAKAQLKSRFSSKSSHPVHEM